MGLLPLRYLTILLTAVTLGFQGTAAAQHFEYRTFAAGIGSAIGTNGVAVADFNGNGLPDIYVVVKDPTNPNDTSTWSRLFYNRGDGTFGLITPANVLAGADSSDIIHKSYGNKVGASWGDFNGSGYPDLYLTHLGPNQLLRNNGDGTFTDVTAQAGVAGGLTQFSTSALWFDYNLNGRLDLYVSVLDDHGSDPPDRSNRLYENLGDGTFADVTAQTGVGDTGYTWMTVALDVTGNGYPDLYLANDFGENSLYLNHGDGTFTEAAEAFNLNDPWHGMGLAVSDVSGNGLLDIYLTNISDGTNPLETNPLFLNTGNGYVDVAQNAGVAHALWGWGTEFFDATHDGREDLIVVTGKFIANMPNVFFRNVSSEHELVFEEVASTVGLASMPAARGLAVFDFDGDGDLDVLVSNFLEPLGLYRNQLAAGNWLQIDLEATISNPHGWGATIEILAGGQMQRRYHHGAQFLGQHILPVHFGLGDVTEVDLIEIRWPSGVVDLVQDVGSNQRVRIREKEGLVVGTSPSPGQDSGRPILQLLPPYPNPAGRSVEFGFVLHSPAAVVLSVFDLSGREVYSTPSRSYEPGRQAIRWSQSGDSRRFAAGTYVYRIATEDGHVAHGRVTVLGR